MSVDKSELKIRALLERISSLTTSYENQVADLRVELTLTSEQFQETVKQLNELREQHADFSKAEHQEEPTS